MARYRVFNRSWWMENPAWPDGLEPCMGKKHYHRKAFDTQEQARKYCQDWNRTHKAGRLSNKCEFESTS